ncbi:Neural-cadherin [Cyphomyrmex costatus]|uniref:Neural-cadherin n=1 Tax=Cyphomyrmex costatus TaxID=456900 RepID=A0A195CJ96_9HYME|nr:Neural-cadherin [Cyphomyrmex costatus]
MAKDRGYPPLSRTVEVQIDVVDRANNPPVWDHVVYGPIYIKENMAVGAKVVSIKARHDRNVECTGNIRLRSRIVEDIEGFSVQDVRAMVLLTGNWETD